MLRLSDLMSIIDAQSMPRVMVAEIKHATYFASIGLPLDELFAAQIAGWATADNLIVESFEQPVLGQIRARGVAGRSMFLVESSGAPADLVARFGPEARTYAEHLSPAGLAQLAGEVDGVSVDKKLLLAMDDRGRIEGTTDVVRRAHEAGLDVFTWTLRAENRFLAKNFRVGVAAGNYGNWMDEFTLVVSSGVVGVFADQPDLVLAALADR